MNPWCMFAAGFWACMTLGSALKAKPERTAFEAAMTCLMIVAATL